MAVFVGVMDNVTLFVGLMDRRACFPWGDGYVWICVLG